MTRRHTHLWCPDIFQFKGGIQRYSGFLLRALEILEPEDQRTVFLMHDKRTEPSLTTTAYHCSGRFPTLLRPTAFAVGLLFAAYRDRPHRIITTHIHFTPLAHFLRRTLGIPYWTIAHGVEAWEIARPGVCTALRAAERVISVSTFTETKLRTAEHLANLELLPNTFDENRFHPEPRSSTLMERYGIQSDQPVILTVARLEAEERYKGYDQVVRALPAVLHHLPDVRYLLVGRGSDEARVRGLASELGVTKSVIFAGEVADDELCSHYNLADLFVMPSRGEGFGIVFLEALGCGKPVIAGNSDGSQDALLGGELGMLIDPGDTTALSDAILSILLQDDRSRQFLDGAALRSRVIEEFGMRRFTSRLGALLASAERLR